MIKRAFTKIVRFFSSRRFLKFVLWAITLIVFFYVEENWRGAREWSVTKAKWEAKGESFDIAKFIPPPIPHAENLAALPLFKMETVESSPGRPDSQPISLKKATRYNFSTSDLPTRGNWMRGELPDLGKIGSGIATQYAATFKGRTPPADTLAQFTALYPFIPGLLIAASTRPLCRFDIDYTIFPPFDRSAEPLPASLRLSILLSLHASLALDRQRPDLALQDIETNYKLAAGANRDTTLVSGLFSVGIAAITGTAIYNGLTRHAWNDTQLIELQQTISQMNFLAQYQFDIRCEARAAASNLDYIKETPRFQLLDLWSMSGGGGGLWQYSPQLWPRGWWDQNKCQNVSLLLRQVATIDPSAHRVFRQIDRDLENQVNRDKARWDADAPWNFFYTTVCSNLTPITRRYAYAQNWVDEEQIVCALERYRLAHANYPAALDALAPAFLADIPHDIMTGQPLHYRLRPDGTFLLYSVGWNETDDGGKIVFKKDEPTRIDDEEGDWAWPMPVTSP